MWMEAIEAKFDGKGKPYGRAEFDKLLGHCQGVSDIPAILFAEELLAAYPDAKVILTHRNFDTWYKYGRFSIQRNISSMADIVRSCLETCERRFAHPLTKGLIPITKFLRMHSQWTRPAFKRSWEILFDGDFPKNAKMGYERHYEHVRSLVPQDRLLEYYVKDGWEPLCKFLHVDHPEVEFPRGNTTETLNKRFGAALKLTLTAVFLRLAVLGVGVMLTGYASVFLYRHGLLVLKR
jgi:hypothetical protein